MRKFTLKCIATIPLPILYGLSKPLYLLLFYIARYRRTIAENNLRNSFPSLNEIEVQALLKLHYRNFCDIILEMLKTINLKPEQLKSHITLKDTEAIENYLNNDQTIILSLAHQCNMEWATIATSQQLNFPMDGIYKPLHQKWLNELTIESRSQYGITLIPAKTCITELIKRAKQTRIIAIAPDQAPRRRDDAYWTTFLNQETPFYLGLEKIATLFKYPVFFMEVERTGRGQYQATFKQLTQPPYEKESSIVSKTYVSAVEEQILNQPQDWLWIHKRWKKKKSLYE